MSFHRVLSCRTSTALAFGALLSPVLACSGTNPASPGSLGSPDGGATAQGNTTQDAGSPVVIPVDRGGAIPDAGSDAFNVPDGSSASADAAPASACPAGQLMCGGGCIPSDLSNCGACGAACTAPSGAVASCGTRDAGPSCQWTCDATHMACGSACLAPDDFQTDHDNCGSCGHSCIGGACTAGQCQAWTIAKTDAVQSSQDPSNYRAAIATDGTNAVWLTAEGQAFEAPIGGGQSIALSAKPSNTVTAGSIAIANGVVVWTLSEGGAVLVMKATSNVAGSASLVATGATTTQTPCGIAINESATKVYYKGDSNTDGTQDVYEISLSASPATITSIAHTPPATGGAGSRGPIYDDIALASKYLFWTDSYFGNIMRYSFADGKTKLVAPNQTPYRLAVDTTNVYWLNGGPDTSFAKETFSVSWTGKDFPSTPTSVPWVNGQATGLASDGNNVYYTCDLTTFDSQGAAHFAFQIDHVGVAGGTPVAESMSGHSMGLIFGGGAEIWADLSNAIYGRRLN